MKIKTQIGKVLKIDICGLSMTLSQHKMLKVRGKTVIITGSNSGIGKETAIELAVCGAKVIMACRNKQKSLVAMNDIKKQSKSENVHFMKLDLTSLQSVRNFAKEFLEQHSELHILINNAGVMMTPYGKTEDGFETQIGTNHFGHFLLTNLLLKRMMKSENGRIINVTSMLHHLGTINFDDINSEKHYNKLKAYSQSKLANILFTKELNERLRHTNITSYAVHPGIVDTGIGQHFGILQPLFKCFAKTFAKNAKQGAATTIYCALTIGLEKDSGCYFKNSTKANSSRSSNDMEAARKLWKLSEELTKCKFVI